MNETANIQNADELAFAIFCIENVAQDLGVPAPAVYKAFVVI